MGKAGKIISINPPRAIPGGEIFIECENFQVSNVENFGCFFGGQAARIVGASPKRLIAAVPDDFDAAEVKVHLESDGDKSNSFNLTVGKKLADDLHIVANPAVDPKDDSIVLTRSGSRGQQLPVTLFRLDKHGFLNEMSAEIMNPTGVAFDQNGQLFVTARADGEVYRIDQDDENAIPFASELGVATGIAFDKNGVMFVGDRSGTLYRVTETGSPESFALLEPSVSAYHLAFGADENLYVTAPGLSGFDAIFRVDRDGFDEIFYRGLGRPQGLAFDRAGNLYVAASSEGRQGIMRIVPDGEKAEIFVTGVNVIGLCFTRKGEMIVATNEAVYSLPIDIEGILLD